MKVITASGRRGLAWAAAFLILFAIAIPWYWRILNLPPDGRIGGLPTWFVVAVLGSLAVSLLAAWKLRRPWPGEQGDRDGQEP